jgi:pilus assembly protein CpaF
LVEESLERTEENAKNARTKFHEIKESVLSQIDLSKDTSDEEIKEIIHRTILSHARTEYISLEERNRLGKEVFNALRKLDFVQELLEDDEITEIMINGPDRIFIEKAGKILLLDRQFESVEKLEDMIQQIVASCNRTVNERSPIADARLADGCRVNIVLSPPSVDGAIVTIRRFPKNNITMDDLIRNKTITKEAADFLKDTVERGFNIFVSGGTSSGKTTLLNVLSGFVPETLRVVCIEDSAELKITHIPNLVRLETRNATAEGGGEITIRDLIRCALRMRPDRIIVGEVRGGEAMDMLQAMNTGHDGSLSTGHANSAEDMLLRLEAMVLMGSALPVSAIRRQIATGIDLIVHLDRDRNGNRKVVEIIELLGMEGEEIKTHPIFVYGENGETDSLIRIGETKTVKGYKGKNEI